jgi:hypothetical protein
MTTQLLDEHEATGGQVGHFYTVFIDDVEYRFDHTPVTGRELMDTAGIPQPTGLVLLLEDGSQQAVGLDEQLELKPGRRFKKAPRFKRG